MSTTATIIAAVAAAVDEMIAQARRDGAAEAFRIARAHLSTSERGIEWDKALDIYADTFGEMAE